jgi:hypothetical protein
MSLDATLTWDASPSDDTTGYLVPWLYTAAGSTTPQVVPPITVPRTAAQDASGYSLDFVTSVASITPPVTPPIVVGPGDTIGLAPSGFQVVDATDNLFGPAQTVPSVTEPVSPVAPQSAPNLALTLS